MATKPITPTTPPAAVVDSNEEFVKCDCCGLTEECTPAYIARVRESYGGQWICGLCGEAVKDCKSQKNLGSTEEALQVHMKFCQQFRLTPPTGDLISAVKNLLRRSLNSPRKKKVSVFPSSEDTV